MAYQASGTIHKLFDTEQKTDTFQTREFVIEVADGQYPQLIRFQLVQDKCSLMDDFNEGDAVDVDFDLRGREWNGKYFTNLQAWRVNRSGESGDSVTSGQGQGVNTAADTGKTSSGAATASAGADFDDDIPF